MKIWIETFYLPPDFVFLISKFLKYSYTEVIWYYVIKVNFLLHLKAFQYLTS